MPGLPDRPSLEYLRKLAKERLRVLRAESAGAKLADAQLEVAREHGFASWRTLKAELDRRRAPVILEFFEACRAGDVERLRGAIAADVSLVRERDERGATGLHHAARHADAIRLLIEHGADPNARDADDNATPLHVAAANRALESVRILLDAGADPRGTGDLHNADVIGWASCEGNEAVIGLLLERGARHHIFSAIATRDAELVERVVEQDPAALGRRRSRFENGNTALHDTIAPAEAWRRPDHAMLQQLIDLGADIEATDGKGRTPLELAMLRGDREAMGILTAAGAREPRHADPPAGPVDPAAAARSVSKAVPMFFVRDMRATVRWYESLGFGVRDQYEDGGELVFAEVSFGNALFTLSAGGDPGPRDVRLWFITDRVEELYRTFKERALSAARRAIAGKPDDTTGVRFEEDLYTPFYGGRQFSIRDINDLALIFWDPPAR
jgi:ankyrin repeat protein